jgi:hypothetical protein
MGVAKIMGDEVCMLLITFKNNYKNQAVTGTLQICKIEHRVGNKPAKRLILKELFEQFGVVLKQRNNYAFESLVVFEAGGVGRVLLCVFGSLGRLRPSGRCRP